MNTRLQFMAFAAVCLFGVSAQAGEHTPSPEAELAERYGISGWDQIQQIEFTFNVQLPNRDVTIVRQWQWRTGSDPKVIRRIPTGDTEVQHLGFNPYIVNEASTDIVQDAHQQFINDTYWLLFPFQLIWSDPAVTEVKTDVYPFAEKGEHRVQRKLICQWPEEGGYTPGDAYDLYLGEDGLIQQWVFRRGGQEEGHAHTWEDHQQLGPIIVSLDHHRPGSGGEGSGFRLWFTDVKATLIDGTVVEPQPIAEP